MAAEPAAGAQPDVVVIIHDTLQTYLPNTYIYIHTYFYKGPGWVGFGFGLALLYKKTAYVTNN